MTTTAATIEKMNALQASDYSMVIDLIDHLSMAGSHIDDESGGGRIYEQSQEP